MGRSDARPRAEHVPANMFVSTATQKGFSEADARRVWRRVVEKVKEARYDANAAMAEFITRGQLKDVADGTKSQFRAMTDGDWKLIQGVAAQLTKGL